MVRAKALEIRWHDQMPIFSADFHAFPPEAQRKIAHPYAMPSASTAPDEPTAATLKAEEDKIWRLATAGGDKLVRIWLVHPRPPPPPAPVVLGPSTSKLPAAPLVVAPPDTSPRVEYLATLKQHTGVVNVVRFCPIGELLASAGDDGNVLFWVPGESTAAFGESHEDKAYERESWRVKSMLRTKSGQEIYDLAWSPDGNHVLVGSVDHTANIYDVSSGQLLHTIAEHTNYVQGVAWDPHNHFIATQSSDRSMHIYSLDQTAGGGFQVHAVGKSSRMEVQHPPASSWRAPEIEIETSASTSLAKDKGKDSEYRPPPMPPLRRSASQRSDSDRSETSSTHGGAASAASRFSLGDALPSPATTAHPLEELTSMEPPAHRPSSRRSSTSGSQSHLSSHSPALLPQVPTRHLRSPSPAPLPAVRVPSSPKLAPVPTVASAVVGVGKAETIKLYGDANSTPFFRRLCWSTDGSLLLTPAGLFEDPYASIAKLAAAEDGAKRKAAASAPTATKKADKDASSAGSSTPKPTVYIYSRSNIARPPIAHLPGHKTTSIAIRFCPILWELRKLRPAPEGGDEEGDECLQIPLEHHGVSVTLPGAGEATEGETVVVDAEEDGTGKPKSLFDLPYRMVYAVATLDAVFLYDTQQASPICMFGNLHYAPFTDLTWSSDGETLVVSSQDGYCSVIAFDPLELGTPYTNPLSFPGPALLSPLPPPPLSTVPTLFAALAQQQHHPKPVTPVVSTSVSGVVPEKRIGDAPDEDDVANPPVKKKKKVALTYHGPLGTT